MNIEKLKNLAISENGFIFDPLSGYSYNVNDTALNIIRMLKSGLNKTQITAQLLDEYDTIPGHLDSDLEHFLQMLMALDLVDEEDQNSES